MTDVNPYAWKRERMADLIYEMCTEIVTTVDSRTLDAGLSLYEAAEVYRAIAAECGERANGLDDEADRV